MIAAILPGVTIAFCLGPLSNGEKCRQGKREANFAACLTALMIGRKLLPEPSFIAIA
jgi:hypothetical protein